MASFKDKLGRVWPLELDIHLVEQVEQRCAVKLDELLGDQFAGLTALAGDRRKFFAVLWVMCEEGAAKANVPPEDFARAMNGDAIECAFDAFVGAVADFCPRHQRDLVKAVVARGKEVLAADLPKQIAAIAAFVPESSTSATPAAPSSASTPAPGG